VKHFVALLALLLLAPCAAGTDLGPGNEAVAARYEAWVAKGARTQPPPVPKEGETPARRVMVTGFGLFSGVTFNVSGMVVESMANPEFWPAEMDLRKAATPPKEGSLRRGVLKEDDGGARVWQRTLVIDGRRFEVAFLLLDVLWDLAPAIVLHEARTFRPDFVLMTGRGGREAVLEGGSRNRATPHPGFRADGAPDEKNRPRGKTVLDPALEGVESDVAATWDNVALAAAVTPLVREIDERFEVLAPAGGRAENDYICNNVTNVVLHALKGVEVPLAGDRIRLRADLPGVEAGFFHYPAGAKDDPAEAQAWARVLATILRELARTAVAPSAPAR
jgi:hypothetical protein